MAAEEKSWTNVFWYVVLLFLVIVFVVGIQNYASAMLKNPDINETMTNETFNYIMAIYGINTSKFDVTDAQLTEDSILGISNDTGSQAKDNALEFFYSRSQASKLGTTAKNVLSLPGFIIILLGIPANSIAWLISILNWFWRLAILIAGYYAIRGIK